VWQMETTPVTVLTGFLGSGKTTVLRHLLTRADMSRLAVIINEFGEIGLDHDLVESSNEQMVLLKSGCACCSVRGDLITTLRAMAIRRARNEMPEFDRVVIETTGLADPAPILHTLMTDGLIAARYRLDGIVTVLDAVQAVSTLDRFEEATRQAAMADRLLVTKTDLCDQEALTTLNDRLAALNPRAAPIVATHGRVSPDAIFNAGLYDPASKTADVRRWLADEAIGERHGHGPHGAGEAAPHKVHRHTDKIRTCHFVQADPVDGDALSLWLESLMMLRGENFLRTKGIVNVRGQDGPVVIHGVQHIFHPPAVLDAWPSSDRRTRIVFITKDIDLEVLQGTFRMFQGQNDAPPVPGSFMSTGNNAA
jgi:G3E family GTPase